MSVNLSLRQLCDDGLIDAVESAIAHGRHPAPRRSAWRSPRRRWPPTRRARSSSSRQLKRLGVSLSLDDFGVGVSSLSVLDSYPVDMLKIDRSFVHRLATACGRGAYSPSVVGVAHALGLRAVAEGVETQEQLERDSPPWAARRLRASTWSRPGTAALIGPGLLRSPTRRTLMSPNRRTRG